MDAFSLTSGGVNKAMFSFALSIITKEPGGSNIDEEEDDASAFSFSICCCF